MDITDLSMALSQQKLMNNVGIAMMAKSLDLVDQETATLTNMIGAMPSQSLESLVNPMVGGNIDLCV